MRRALATMAVAMAATGMTAPAHAATRQCTQKVIYVEGSVRVARPGSEFVACLNSKRYALDVAALEELAVSGPFLQFSDAEGALHVMDLRTGERRIAVEGGTNTPRALTASGSLAYETSWGSRGDYGAIFKLFSFAADKSTELASYGCGRTAGCDPSTKIEAFALAPDATAYWRYGDGRLGSAVRSEAAAKVPAPPPFRARKRPCVSNIVSARNQRRIAALSAKQAGYCRGGKLRHKLGDAYGFRWAGDWLTYFRRGEHFDALRLLNVVTGEDRILAPGDIRSAIEVVGALEDGTVVWARRSSGPATSVELVARNGRTGRSKALESWCSGVACRGEQSEVVHRGFALAPEGTVFWRAPDGTVGSASVR